MDKISKFILKEFSLSFFTIFFVISSIISLIYIITISNITSKIEITFFELLKFYLLSLPQIILITLSISFFISSINVYSRLSETQELIAFFSLGFKPKKILISIFILGVLISFLNTFILFVSIPYAKMAFNNLKYKKLQESKFNFHSSKISQQFGKWSVFAQNENKNNYSNIYLFSIKDSKFIFADKSSLKNNKNFLEFNLFNGKIYDLNKTYVINYKQMKINNPIPQIKLTIFKFNNYFNYFKKDFAKYLPIALLPIVFIFFIPLFSFYHPRLSKKNPLLLATFTLSIYGIISLVNKNFLISFIIVILFFILGGILYKWKIKF